MALHAHTQAKEVVQAAPPLDAVELFLVNRTLAPDALAFQLSPPLVAATTHLEHPVTLKCSTLTDVIRLD